MAEAPSMILALTSEADETKAEALALVLLERRLVACVTLTPMRSLYRWQGEVQQDREVQLLLKTSLDCLAELRQTVMGCGLSFKKSLRCQCFNGFVMFVWLREVLVSL